MNKLIYLASSSLRRCELLRQLSIDFELIVAPIDETPFANEKPQLYVERMAKDKAKSGWQVVLQKNLAQRLLLAADTSVVLDGAILGKPKDADDARCMLNLLSGKSHQVISSVALCKGAKILLASSVSEVVFCKLSPSDIESYLLTDECFGKAGAYAIQGKAARFIAKINGSFSGVVGLPLFETAQLLKQADYSFSW